MIICAALVFFMTPGLAFFYGGLVRRKNVVNTMMACVSIMGVAIVMWCLFGYSLAFGGNHGGIIGDFRWFGLNGVGMETGPYSDTIPHLVFCVCALRLYSCLLFYGQLSCTILWLIWYGAKADFWLHWVLLTLQEETWFISVQASAL